MNEKKLKVAKIIMIVSGVILVGVIVAVVVMQGGPPRPPGGTSPPEDSTPPPMTFDPITLTGSSDKTTAPFTITTDEWIIEWSYDPDPEYVDFAVFGFFVYPRGETEFFVESILFPENTSGSTYSYAGPGEYYIKVTCANLQSWTIVISPA